MIKPPDFQTKADLFAHLRNNKALYIAAKKAEPKHADAVAFQPFTAVTIGEATKAAATPAELLDMAEFQVKVAINTTNIRDSHKDVHLPGIWKKSLQETKGLYLLQEHKMEFTSIISDKVKATAETFTWKQLGFDYPGSTEALVFDAAIEKDRNQYMAEQYAKGRVKNHSVGMQYVKIELAMNSDDKYDQVEKAVWDKYIGQIVNAKDFEQEGYFWAVTEAKVVEGSAVPVGSNFTTPTISINGEQPKALDTAGQATAPEPLKWDQVTEAIKQSFINN